MRGGGGIGRGGGGIGMGGGEGRGRGRNGRRWRDREGRVGVRRGMGEVGVGRKRSPPEERVV